jgi:hypothetical protein
MKISDITQRSQVQHIAEGRKQLDEVGLLGLGMKALQAAGIIGTGVDAAKNYSAWRDGKISGKELIARTGGDLALGLGLGAGAAGAKSAFKGGKKLLGKGDNVRDLVKQKNAAQREIRKQQDRLDKLKGRTNLTPAGKTARKKILDPKKQAAVADKKAINKQLDKNQGTKTKDIRKYGTAGLAVPDMLDPARDPAYKALGGANKSGQPTAGTGMGGGNAGGGDGKTDAQRAAERASRYKSDFITKGITTIDPR